MNRIAMSAIKARHRGHWFDAATMRFFNCELPLKATQTEHGAWFVSAERPTVDHRLEFTIRFQDSEGDIVTIGEHCQFDNRKEATSVMRRLMALPYPESFWKQFNQLRRADDNAIIAIAKQIGTEPQDVRDAIALIS